MLHIAQLLYPLACFPKNPCPCSTGWIQRSWRRRRMGGTKPISRSSPFTVSRGAEEALDDAAKQEVGSFDAAASIDKLVVVRFKIFE